MAEFNFEALCDNLIYVLKESQMKVGYTDNAASLNYPPESLARLLGTEPDDVVLRRALEEFSFYAERILGQITVSVYDGQYCLTIPPKGVRYVHENVGESPFLRELIDGIRQHRFKDIGEVLDVFYRYYDHGVDCMEIDGDGYDHVVRVMGEQSDGFVYLFDTAFGHISYHRMTWADYTAEMADCIFATISE